MTSYVISSGVTTSYSLMTGDTLRVASGGVSDGSYVGSGAREYVLSGGESEFDEVGSSGLMILSSGATVANVQVEAGGSISGPGNLVGTSYDFGLVSGVTLLGGASYVALYVTGETSGVSVENAGRIFVNAGGSSLGDKVLAGGDEFVSSGGYASGVIVSAGGLEYLLGGAIASDVTILSGGSVDMTAVFSGGTYTVQDNPVAATSLGGVILKAGATLDLYGATVMSGATLSVASGAAVSNVLVSSGGHLDGPGALGGYYNSVFGTISGVGLDNAYLYVEAGATASGVAVQTDGYMVVEAGGEADGTTVNGTYADFVISVGGVASGTVIANSGSYGAEDYVYGSALATTISSGGAENVFAGGYASGALVSSGGVQHVYAGGVVTNVHVMSGGTEVLDAGASATAVIVASGGVADLAVVVSSGASLTLKPNPISAATTLSGVTVDVGGRLVVTSALVDGAGVLSLTAGAAVQNLTVAAGGQVDGPGTVADDGDDFGLVSGIAIGDTQGDYGYFEVESGGVASGVSVVEGQLIVLVSGRANGANIEGAGASDSVYGSALGTLVRSGGEETVQAGGSTRGTRVFAGGVQLVQSGGLVGLTTISSGGLEVLSSGATASAVTVNSGGEVEMFAVISSGVSFTLSASPLAVTSATLDGVTVNVGGTLDVTGAIVSSGGTLSLASGAVTEMVIVEAGGHLYGPGDLQGANTDSGTVSAVTLGDAIGTGSLLVASGGTADAVAIVNGFMEVAFSGVTSGTLLEGASAVLQVDAGGVASGTMLEAPGASDQVYGSAVGTIVSRGTTEYVEFGGVAAGSHILVGGEQIVSSGGLASASLVLTGGVEFLAEGASAVGVQVRAGGEVELAGIISSGGRFTLSASPLAAQTSLAGLGAGVSVAAGGLVDLYSVTVMSTGVLTLAAGAVASGVTVSAGGRLSGAGAVGGGFYDANNDYGVVSGVQVGDGVALDFGGDAQLAVEAGGVANGVTVLSGLVTVMSGGLASGIGVEAGGELIVSSGGTAEAARISAGGLEIVSAGAMATGDLVSNGATLALDGGTIASGVTAVAGRVGASVTSSGVKVYAGGIIEYDDVVVMSGGVLSLGLAGLANSVVIATGGTASGAGVLGGDSTDLGLVSGILLEGLLGVSGDAYGVKVGDTEGDAGEIDVESGGVARAALLVDGRLVVSSGGVASRTEISSGASVEVLAGGVVDVSLISSGGVQTVDGGATDSGTIVYAGGTDILDAGATAVAVTVDSGGAVDVGLVVSADQTYTVSSAGVATTVSGITIKAGGLLNFTGASVQSGATLSLAKGAIISGAVMVSAGGTVSGAGELGGTDQYDYIYGKISGLTVGDTSGDAAAPVIWGGAVADNITVTNGALFVEGGGVASGVLVNGNFAEIYIVEGGLASNVTLGGDGAIDATEDVVGAVIGTTVSSGGFQDVYGGGGSHPVASNTTVLSGGFAGVAGGGTVVGLVVMSGGAYDVNPGATISSARMLSGSYLEVYSASYVLNAGATLDDGAVTSNTTISGIVLSSGAIAEYDNVTVMSGATMSFASGGPAVDLTVEAGGIISGSADLLGYAVDYGVLIDPTIGAAPGGPFGDTGFLDVESGAVVTGAALSGFSDLEVLSLGTANGTIVGSGDEQDVYAGAVASSARVLSGGTEYVVSGAVLGGTVVSSGGVFELASGVVKANTTLIDSGVVSATVLTGDARLLSGALLIYADYTVSSGGVLSVTSAGAAGGATVLAGGIVSGEGALVDGTLDYGLVTGVDIGTPGGGGTVDNAHLQVALVPQVYSGSLSGDYGEVVVESGGVVSGVNVEGAGEAIVLAGGVTRMMAVSGFLLISSGGTDSSSTILSGGEIDLVGGASAIGTTVSSGAYAYLVPVVSSGQVLTVPASSVSAQTLVDGLTLESGAYLEVADATVLAGGVLSLGAGAVTNSVVVSSGGFLTGPGAVLGYDPYLLTSVTDDGVVSGVTISSYALLNVESGGAAGGVTLAGGGDLTVFAGAYASGVTIDSGSLLVIEAGATVSGDSLGGGGEGAGSEYVYGVADGDRVYAGGYEAVDSTDAVANGAVVYSGGEQDVAGTVSGTTVLSGGTLLLEYSAVTSGCIVASGGFLQVTETVAVEFETLTDGPAAASISIGGVVVSAGGVVDYNNVDLYGSGTLVIAAGGASMDVYNYDGLVSGPGVLTGESYNQATVEGIVLQGYLSNAGTASGLTVASGGELLVDANGTDSGTMVSNGGVEVVDGGVAAGTVVSSGGVQQLYYGTASGTVVLSGGTEIVQNDDTPLDTTVSSGGTIALGVTVSAGQSYTAPIDPTTATTVFGGVTLEKGATLMLQSAQIDSGGTLDLAAGALAAYVTVDAGGVLSGAGSVEAELNVQGGATVAGVNVLAGTTDYYYGGATETGVTLSSGALLVLLDGVVSSGAAVTAGVISATTVVSGATLLSGATSQIQEEVVSSGGVVSVTSSGFISEVTTLAGGKLVDTGSAYFGGGTETLAGGLSGTGQLIEDGGGDLVLAGVGTAFTGVAEISYAGTIEVASKSGLGAASVDFLAASGQETLQIDTAATPANNGTFANIVANFASTLNAIDIRGLSFVKGATATLSGSVLTLIDGARTLHFTLAAQAASAFQVTADAAGGTVIAPTAAGAAALVQALASFSGGGAVSAAGSKSGPPGLGALAEGAPGGSSPLGPSSVIVAHG